MEHLSQIEIANWTALYSAAGLCYAIAMVLSVAMTLAQKYKQRVLADIRTLKDAVIFVPRSWSRWQKLYHHSTPMTLFIVSWIATTLSWR